MHFWRRTQENHHQNQCKTLSDQINGPIIIPANYQHLGSRKIQEDSFAFSNLTSIDERSHKGILAIIADGMGGLDHGEKASQIAVDIFLKAFDEADELIDSRDFLHGGLLRANAAVYDSAFTAEGEFDLGTTLVAVLIKEDYLYWVSVGDSRIYHFSNGVLNQLTKDHVYGNHLDLQVADGQLTRKEAEEHPERGYLTGYLGLPAIVEVDLCEHGLKLVPGDLVMLCSDGLYNSLSKQEMIQLINENPRNSAETLGHCAIGKGLPYQDNLTVLTLSYL